jgi:DNA-binding SARP family transcriptional activator
MVLLAIDLFGGFDARSPRGRRLRLPRRKSQALLAYLALRPGRRFSRDSLAALLWGDLPDDQARHGLRQALLDLRHSLPVQSRAVVLIEGDQIALDARAVEVDVATFERLVAAGGREALERAASLYRGDLLEGLGLDEAGFEEWLSIERDRLHELGRRALRKLLAEQTSTQDLERAVETAIRLLAMDPLQESAHRDLMHLYETMGRRSAALRQYERCADVLRRELGVAPEEETKRLHATLMAKAEAVSRAIRPVPRGERGLSGAGDTDVPFVGRANELERIQLAIAEVSEGRGRIILLSGEAGIGKTRLIQEIATHGRGRGFRFLSGRCYALTRILAFAPWIEAFRTAGLTEDQSLLDRLGPDGRAELARLLPEIARSYRPAPEPEDYLHLFETVATLAEGLALEQPLLVVLEDIQWADEMSVRLLSHLARRLRSARVLLAVTLRDDEPSPNALVGGLVDDFMREWHTTRVAVPALSQSDAVVLAHAMAKADLPATILEDLGAQVWNLSQGNPFMVVETMRSLNDSSGNGAPPPGSRGIGELIERRLALLGAAARGVAAVFAAAGRDLQFDVLQRASGLSEHEAADAVGQLIRRRILREDGDSFDFVHDIIREVVSKRLIAPQRRALHRVIAESFEALRSSTLDAHVVPIATHYLEAEMWDRAVHYLGLAADQAIERSALRDAGTFLERALHTIGRLPDDAQNRRRFVDLVLKLHVANGPIALSATHLELVRRARSIAESLDDPVRLAWILARLGRSFYAAGQALQVHDLSRRAIALGEDAGDNAPAAYARTVLAEICYFEGNDREGIAVGLENLSKVAHDLRYSFGQLGLPSVTVRMYLAWSLSRQGEFTDALRYAHEAMRLAQSDDRPYCLSSACLALGIVHLTKGELNKAIPPLEQGLQLNRTRIRFHRAGFTSMLGQVYAHAGRLDEALPLLEESLEYAVLAGKRLEALRLAPLAIGYLHAGRIEEATRNAERGLALAREFDLKAVETQLLQIHGLIALRRDPPDAAWALSSISEALIRAEELGYRPFTGHCHLGLGRALRAAGRPAEAEKHLDIALGIFRRMEMPHWIAVTEGVLETGRIRG